MEVIDLKNAFNTLSRKYLGEAIMELDPQMFAYVQWAYGDVTPILMSMEDGTTQEVLSMEGIRQGDGLAVKLMGGMMYCAMRELIKKVPGLDMDDLVDNMTLTVRLGLR